jgi:hypothetical protein
MPHHIRPIRLRFLRTRTDGIRRVVRLGALKISAVSGCRRIAQKWKPPADLAGMAHSFETAVQDRQPRVAHRLQSRRLTAMFFITNREE